MMPVAAAASRIHLAQNKFKKKTKVWNAKFTARNKIK